MPIDDITQVIKRYDNSQQGRQELAMEVFSFCHFSKYGRNGEEEEECETKNASIVVHDWKRSRMYSLILSYEDDLLDVPISEKIEFFTEGTLQIFTQSDRIFHKRGPANFHTISKRQLMFCDLWKSPLTHTQDCTGPTISIITNVNGCNQAIIDLTFVKYVNIRYNYCSFYYFIL